MTTHSPIPPSLSPPNWSETETYPRASKITSLKCSHMATGDLQFTSNLGHLSAPSKDQLQDENWPLDFVAIARLYLYIQYSNYIY